MKAETQKAILAAAGRYIRRLLGGVEKRIKALEDRQDEIPALVQRAVDAIPRPQDGRSVTVEDVEPLLRSMVDSLPPPEPGKSVTLDDIRPVVEEAVTRAVEAIPAPKDGTSVDPDEVRAMVDQAVSAIPAPKDGKDADPAVIERMVADAVAALPRPRDGRDGPTKEEVRGMIDAAVAAIPKPQDGKSVTVEEVLDAVMPRLQDRFEARLAEAALDFERRAQGVLERAIAAIPKPQDGRDGLDLRHFKAEQVDERTVTLTLTDGERTEHVHLTFPVVIDRGVFSEVGKPGGGRYEKGDGVTFGGSFWIAQVDDPQGVPGLTKDWRLAVKKGRDGKSVARLPDKPTGPVRLHNASRRTDGAATGGGEGGE